VKNVKASDENVVMFFLFWKVKLQFSVSPFLGASSLPTSVQSRSSFLAKEFVVIQLILWKHCFKN